MDSPNSKRSRLDSPLPLQAPLALPGSSWKPPHQSQIRSQQNLFTAGNKLGLAGLNDVASPAEENRASGSGSGAMGAGPGNAQTDFDAMNDAIGIAGVDIAAEEELARSQATLFRTGNRNYSVHSQQAWVRSPRVKIMDFLDKQNLTSMVQHIAASFQLKTLEPAILDVLTQAAEARIHTLVVDSIAAKDHRAGATHLRAAPLYPSVEAKGKQKVREPEAMYEQVVYDRSERILSMLARVEGEEEREARQAREAANGGAETAEVEAPGRAEAAKLGQARKEKKRKREGPGQLARNMSEDARARQSNQTAMRSVGGRSKYSWLSGGVVPASARAAPAAALMAALPAPKFAPPADTPPAPAPAPPKKDSRLGGIVPPTHASTLSSQVGLQDCLFALERERGTGAGKGTGSKTLFKSYLAANLRPSNTANPPSLHHLHQPSNSHYLAHPSGYHSNGYRKP